MDISQHHLLAMFCAVQAWKRNLDGIILYRDPLLTFLRLERLSEERIDFITEAFKPLFSYHAQFVTDDSEEYENELLFSRVSITENIWKDDRIKPLNWPSQLPNEKELFSEILSFLSGNSGSFYKNNVTGYDVISRPNGLQPCLEIWFETIHNQNIQQSFC
ncbi:MAG TPA: hypothetical protein EYQ50_21795 [Verrucomicrobiales bacterium]|nr:hypothetical protein [Verrucomicrobiales bacterium]